MKKSILEILLALVCVVCLSGCVESRTAERVDLGDASIDSDKGKTAQNGRTIDDFGKRIEGLESRLKKLEKSGCLAGPTQPDFFHLANKEKI